MKISGKIKKNKAVIISPDRIKLLCEIILKHCERLEVSGETYSDTKIVFDGVEELLNYDNFKPRRLKGVEIAGYTDFTRMISVEVGDFNLSPLVNYGTTVRCDYNLSSIDAETVFKSDFEVWFEKVKSSYWRWGKFSFRGVVFAPCAFITLVRLFSGNHLDIDLSNVFTLGLLVCVILACWGIIWVLKQVDEIIVGNLFPSVVFDWGEESKRFAKWESFRSNLLWSIIIAVIIGLLTSYLYDTLKGL